MQSHTVLITGASSGIGKATAQRFHAQGATVLLTARRRELLEELAAELGERAHPFALDVTDGAAVDRFFAELPEELREISILVNNAGAAFGMDDVHEAKLSDWQAMVELNITGLLRVVHAVLPGMVERDRGHVINLGSVAGTYPYQGGNIYGACKAFVEQLSLNMRCDLHGKRVRVTNIEPGLVETGFALTRHRGDREKASATYRGIEAIRPEDIAETIVWCACMPPRVNVNRIELMATMQTPAGFRFQRETP